MLRLTLRLLASLAGVALVTSAGRLLVPVNPATIGFVYLLLVLVVASTWGFVEALVASVVCTLMYNLFYLPPVGTLTIADPENLIAMISLLTTSLIASRLSAKAERRAQDAIARRQDVEHLYSFSRAILLIDSTTPFPKQLVQKVAEIFSVSAAVLYDRRSGEIFRAGPNEFEGLDDQLRDSAWQGSSFSDPERRRVITAVRLGSEPIAALALQGAEMPDAVLQGIANLVAIGLERARAEDLTHQVEAAQRSEQLRTALLDAIAHEFKTPLTSIRAATTALLDPAQPEASRHELIQIADEEAEHLRRLIDDTVEMGRLDTAHIDVQYEYVDPCELIRDVLTSLQTEMVDRQVAVDCKAEQPALAMDPRLMRLALKQVVDNALKYSPHEAPVSIRVYHGNGDVRIEVTDRGKGIPPAEQSRIFERFYRSPAVKDQIPGSGLGLSIAYSIIQAHHGDLTVTSRPGETVFRLSLPKDQKKEQN